nr:hypothetical protein [Tanacetum cinerariifolium]
EEQTESNCPGQARCARQCGRLGAQPGFCRWSLGSRSEGNGNGNGNGAVRRKLDSIANQVDEYLVQPVRVAQEQGQPGGGALDMQ